MKKFSQKPSRCRTQKQYVHKNTYQWLSKNQSSNNSNSKNNWESTLSPSSAFNLIPFSFCCQCISVITRHVTMFQYFWDSKSPKKKMCEKQVKNMTWTCWKKMSRARWSPPLAAFITLWWSIVQCFLGYWSLFKYKRRKRYIKVIKKIWVLAIKSVFDNTEEED